MSNARYTRLNIYTKGAVEEEEGNITALSEYSIFYTSREDERIKEELQRDKVVLVTKSLYNV